MNATATVLTRLLLLIGAYALGGFAGKAATFPREGITMVLPAFGIGLALVLLYGRYYAGGAFLGGLLFSVLSGAGLGWHALGTAVGGAVAALLCAHLLHKLDFRPSLERIRDVAAFILLAGLLGPLLSATFELGGLSLEQDINEEALFQEILLVAAPTFIGAILVAPFILAWITGYRLAWSRKKVAEGIVCAVGLAAGTLLSFRSWYAYGLESYPLAYLPYPFLLWGSIRFGQRGATSGTLLVAILAIMALLDGRGPFLMQQRMESFLLLGAYITTLGVSNLLLAAAATERQKAQDSLRESERRYRAVVEDQTDMIWRFREDGTVTFVNEAYCRFHGKPREELLGVKYLPELSDEDRDIPLSYFASLPPDNPTITYDIKLTGANGQATWQQCTTRRLFDERGQTLEFQSVAQDVTRRKMVEDAARDAEQTLRAVLNALVDGLLVADANGRVTAANPAAERIFGRHSTELVGQEIGRLLDPAERGAFDEYLSREVNAGRSRVTELHALRSDGSRVPVDFAMSKVWLGSSTLLIAVIRDISERKRLEEQIRQTQKMEAVGRLAGGVAHDFNNLLQGIGGYTTLLLTSGSLTDRQLEMLEQIDKSVDRATGLTRQLLAFSRQQPLEPRFFSLSSAAQDMEKLLRRLLGENIQLITRCASSGVVVRADPGQMEQVILNLALNARDAMPEGGALTIECREVELLNPLPGASPDFRAGPHVVLSVTDTGSGMSPEVQARLFEPFFTTKPVGKGTGLGLSIVYGIVKQSGGEILVRSELGKGTTFEVYLPRHPDSTLEKVDTASTPPPTSGKETILFVEDNEVVRSLLVEVLGSSGYQVIEAADGEEALLRVSALGRAIDLLVTDLSMPRMDGRTLAARLQSQYPGLRSLFISGYAQDEVAASSNSLPAAHFLQKPFKPDALLRRVREVLDGLPAPAEPAAAHR